jgi:hypothetical protein
MKCEVEHAKKESSDATVQQEMRERYLQILLEQYNDLMIAYQAAIADKQCQNNPAESTTFGLSSSFEARSKPLTGVVQVVSDSPSFDELSTETIVLSQMDPDQGLGDALRPGMQEKNIFRTAKQSIPDQIYLLASPSRDASTISQSITIEEGKHDILVAATTCCENEADSVRTLQYDVDTAEGKIAALHAQLNMTKEVNDEAYNRAGETRGDFLREVIARYRELEKEHQATVQKVKLLESNNKHSNTEPNKQKDLEGDLRAVIQQYRKLEKDYLALLEWKKKETDRAASTTKAGDMSVSTDDFGASPDMRDSQSACTKGKRGASDSESARNFRQVGSRDDQDDHVRLELERNAKSQRISNIERDLEAARMEAEDAKKKQASRESHLRDVIYLYKKLQSEYDNLMAKREGQEGERVQDARGSDDKTNYDLVQLKQELDEAKKLADAAKSKQEERDKHLRDVIYQYKKLQHEHTTLASHVAEIKKQLIFYKKGKNTDSKPTFVPNDDKPQVHQVVPEMTKKKISKRDPALLESAEHFV